LGNDVNPRDQALAYYNLVADGTRSDIEGAGRALSDIQGSDASDPLVLVARGHLAQMGGDSSAAIDLYRAALIQDPSNLLANNNLGTLLAESGQFSAAAALWKSAFELNEDIAALGINLALADCKLGRKSEAQQVLGRVLTYSPGSDVARRKLASIESGEEPCSAS
jgi:Tfp pilus assembly protein PilF